MPLIDRAGLEQAARLVHEQMLPTPQYSWPLIDAAVGAEVFVKHENHAPTGSFKVRGGITMIDWIRRERPGARGICTATRGNHGQSQARAASAAGLRAVIYVPHGNSVEKNEAMRAFGAELVEVGRDFDEARTEALGAAAREDFFFVPPFHNELVRGVATYALELFTSIGDLDRVYVPIGCGSGICGVIAARDALGLDTRIIGVVSEKAPTAKLSFDAGELIETDSAATFADGVAVRVPVGEALAIYRTGAERIVAVSDDEIAAAMRLIFRASHNVAEGAGAAALAGLLREREQAAGSRVAVVLTGGNIDSDVFGQVLRGLTPALT